MARKSATGSRSGGRGTTAARSRGGSKAASGKAAGRKATPQRRSGGGARPAAGGQRAAVKKSAPPASAAAAGRRKAASKPKAAARPAAPRAARPAFRERRQPENLRCTSMSVSLTVDDLARSMKFYLDGVGFHVKDRWERDGKLIGVEMVAGACMVAIAQDDWAKGRDRLKGLGVRFYLETSQDIDAVAERIRARGVVAEGPEDAHWGARLVHLTDPDGFKITLFREQPR